MKEVKEWSGWMIYGGGMILPWTARYDRATCKHDFLYDLGKKYTWRKAAQEGYRCVKVFIVLAETPEPPSRKGVGYE